MAELVGYARVSRPDQKLQQQLDQLAAAGCTRVFAEQVSGAATRRPEYDECLRYLRTSDTLVVVRLDRLGRRVPQLVTLLEQLDQRGVGFRSLAEGMDTSTPGGRALFYFAAIFAGLERDLIRDRTLDGLAAAKAKGRLGGRKPVLSDKQRKAVRAMRAEGMTLPAIAAAMKCGRSTVVRALQATE